MPDRLTELREVAQERDLTPYERGQLRALKRKGHSPVTMPKHGDTVTFGRDATEAVRS